MRQITSEGNSFFRELRRLNQSREIRKQKRYLLGGARLLQEILTAPEKSGLEAVICEAGKESPKLAQNHPNYVLPPALFRQIDFQQVGSPLALLRLPTIPVWDGSLPAGLTLFLPFQDPLNLGTSLRSAAAFGVHRVVLLREAALPFLPKAARGAGSSLFGLQFYQGPGLCELLAEKNKSLFLLDKEGQDITSFTKPHNMGLVAGLEGRGFSLCSPAFHKRLTIPMSGDQESLNGAMAVSIALFALSR